MTPVLASVLVESRLSWSKVRMVSFSQRIGDGEPVAVGIVGEGGGLAYAADIGQHAPQRVEGGGMLARQRIAGCYRCRFGS